jgi:hypothetical protein
MLKQSGQICGLMPVIPALKGWGKSIEFEANLDYIERPCLKKKEKRKQCACVGTLYHVWGPGFHTQHWKRKKKMEHVKSPCHKLETICTNVLEKVVQNRGPAGSASFPKMCRGDPWRIGCQHCFLM